MASRHELDTQNQGMLLPPQASTMVLEKAGVFFPRTPGEIPIEAIEAQYELAALKNLASECGRIGDRQNAMNELVHLDEIIDAKEHEKAKEKLNGRIAAADQGIYDLNIAAKVNFALSLGIAARSEAVLDADGKTPKIDDKGRKMREIILEDPSREEELKLRYRRFRNDYAEPRNSGRRKNQVKVVGADLKRHLAAQAA